MAFAYSKEYDYIMFYNAKSGCSTWRSLFLYLHKDELPNGPSNSHHSVRHDFRLKDNNFNRKKIMVVRNPFSRVVSMYTNKITNNKDRLLLAHLIKHKLIKNNKITFRQFVDILYNLKKNNRLNNIDIHIKEQTCYLKPNTEIVHLENFNKEIIQAYKNIGLDYLVPKIEEFFDKEYFSNKSLKDESRNFVGDKLFDKRIFPNYEYFYDEDIKNKVIEIYKNDFDSFGYTKKL